MYVAVVCNDLKNAPYRTKCANNIIKPFSTQQIAIFKMQPYMKVVHWQKKSNNNNTCKKRQGKWNEKNKQSENENK